MRPCKLKLNEKQKRLSVLTEFFFLMDNIYFCNIGNFLTKIWGGGGARVSTIHYKIEVNYRRFSVRL